MNERVNGRHEGLVGSLAEFGEGGIVATEDEECLVGASLVVVVERVDEVGDERRDRIVEGEIGAGGWISGGVGVDGVDEDVIAGRPGSIDRGLGYPGVAGDRFDRDGCRLGRDEKINGCVENFSPAVLDARIGPCAVAGGSTFRSVSGSRLKRVGSPIVGCAPDLGGGLDPVEIAQGPDR